MHPRIQEVLSALDDTRESLRGIIADIPPARLGVRPSEDRWSVAEIVEHLSLVEGRIAKMLMEKLDAARKAGLGHETDATPVAPMLDIATVIDRSNPVIASEASQPRAGLSVDDGMKLLTERRQGLRNAVVSSDELALASVEVPHARLGTLNLYQWLLFLAGHEARHTDQIREVAATLTH